MNEAGRLPRTLTDEMVREVYVLLIDKSWEDADHFLCLQDAWHGVAAILGIERVEDNGFGKVIWKEDTMSDPVEGTSKEGEG